MTIFAGRSLSATDGDASSVAVERIYRCTIFVREANLDMMFLKI
jgi:hypothetical protein